MIKYIFFNLRNLLIKIPSFYYTLPNRNSLIIFDDINSKYIKSSIDYKHTYEIKFRNKQVNFFAFFYALFFFYRSNFKIEYINFFIKKSKIKILITSNFNRLIVYQIKLYYPEIKVIVIQNGSFGNEFIFKLKKSAYKNFICDFFLCFSDLEKKKIKKIIKAEFIILGSLKNNLYKINNNYKKEQVLYISQYRKELLSNPSVKPIYETEKLLLPIVLNFCIKKNLKFVILPGEEDSINQKTHYENLLKSKNFFFYKRNLNKSYQRVDKSLFSINIDSSLGFEALSRHNKVGFFNFFAYKEKSFNSLSFSKKAGTFYIGFYNKKKINDILEYLYTSDDKVWKNKNFDKLNFIPYVKNNSKLNMILQNLLN